MNRNRWIFALAVLLVSSLACSVFTGGTKAPATEAAMTLNSLYRPMSAISPAPGMAGSTSRSR